MSVQFRAESAEDAGFLRSLILQTIALELGADRWPEPMRAQLLEMQYQNRRMGPRAGFPEGESQIIEWNGTPAGWLFFVKTATGVHLVEIMILPECRGHGVGTKAVRQVISLADGEPVRLTVNVLNGGAIRLYERLGFRRVGGTEVQHEMEMRTGQ
jgi:ribosomal protein S18 acetylase RimI-like enzyme